MFIAKFNQVNSDKFKVDKNGNLPYIGDVLAGRAKGTIINGTVFQRDGMKTQTLYACENVLRDYTNPNTGETTKQVDVHVISEISILDYFAVSKECGPAVLEVKKATIAQPEL